MTTVSAQQDHNRGIKNQWGVKPQTHQGAKYNTPLRNKGSYNGQQSNGGQQDHNRGIKNQWGFRPGTHTPNINVPHTPDNTNDQGASGSNYRLNQPVNQGGVNGVLPGPR